MKAFSLQMIILVFGFPAIRPQRYDSPLSSFCSDGVKEITKQMMQSHEIPANITVLEVCNQITKISPDAFQQFTDLERLTLDGNEHITFPPDGTPFIGHNSLADLSCAHCGINEIFDGTLSSIPNLETINLTGNAIARISSKAFKLNLKIIYIGLSNNNLSHVPPDMIDGLNSLKKLDFSSNNKLASNGNDPFLISTSLQELNCDDCGFRTISLNTFARVINLQKLYLRRNKITSIEHQAFNLHKSLSTLHLQNNRLQTIDYSLLIRSLKLCLEGNSIMIDCNESFSLDLGRFQCSSASPMGIACNIRTTTEAKSFQTTTEQDIFIGTTENSKINIEPRTAVQLASSTSTDPPILMADTFVGISDAYITGYLVVICLTQFGIMALLLGVYFKMEKNDADPKIDCYAENIINPSAFYKAIR